MLLWMKPAPAQFEKAAQKRPEAAQAELLRKRLSDFGLTSFLKTTGGKGLHVVVPIARRYTWPDAKGFAKRVAELMAAKEPERFHGLKHSDRGPWQESFFPSSSRFCAIVGQALPPAGGNAWQAGALALQCNAAQHIDAS